MPLGHIGVSTLADLRLADHIQLTSQAQPSLKAFVFDLIASAKPHGLELHPAKTNLLPASLGTATGWQE